MRNPRFSYRPAYAGSRALVIGINSYQHASPLSYAVNDAEAVADLLKSSLGFPAEHVTLLLDRGATKPEIMNAFMRFTVDDVEPDERILVFFAGHGYTRSGSRGETGFLVPYEGHIDNLSTLIRWDDLTKNAELIAAKHMLFIMDACYSGLGVTRSLQPGSVRYLKDMHNRYTRLALAAGKADEEVADGGGPIPGHSIFTGHLLEALSGKVSAAVVKYCKSRNEKSSESRVKCTFEAASGGGTSDDQEGGLHEDASVARKRDVSQRYCGGNGGSSEDSQSGVETAWCAQAGRTAGCQ